jgi:hypothetical protein
VIKREEGNLSQNDANFAIKRRAFPQCFAGSNPWLSVCGIPSVGTVEEIEILYILDDIEELLG